MKFVRRPSLAAASLYAAAACFSVAKLPKDMRRELIPICARHFFEVKSQLTPTYSDLGALGSLRLRTGDRPPASGGGGGGRGSVADDSGGSSEGELRGRELGPHRLYAGHGSGASGEVRPSASLGRPVDELVASALTVPSAPPL